MNNIPNNTIIITDIVGDFVKTGVSGQCLIDKMKSIGFYNSNESMISPVINAQDKHKIINELISADALFLYGHGWYHLKL